MIVWPIGIIPWTVANLFMTKPAYDRISSFLHEEEIDRKKIHEIPCNSSLEFVLRLNGLRFAHPIRLQSSIQNENLGPKNKSHTEAQASNAEAPSAGFAIDVKEFNIRSGSINMVVGNVGSGKSSLLLSILNEMMVVDERNRRLNTQTSVKSVVVTDSMLGNSHEQLNDASGRYVQIAGRLAYVAQNSWLQNMSIKVSHRLLSSLRVA